ncbi:MAG: tetratricopeptide repeat protein [Pseudomonadota bacterium]
MNLFGRKNDGGIGGASDGGTDLRGFPAEGSGKRLPLLLTGILVIGGVAGGYFYLIGSGEDDIVPVARPAIVKQLPVVAPGIQEVAPTTADVLAAGEKDGFAVPAPPPSPLAAAPPQQQTPMPQDGEAPAVNVAAEPPMPDESSLAVAVSGKPEEVSAAAVPEMPEMPAAEPSGEKEAVAAPVKSPQDVKPAPAPVSGKEESAEPAPAELAIVQNAAVLDSLSPPPSVALGGAPGGAAGEGLLVTDILSQPADIRALPERYLVVRKDRGAGDAGSRLTAARTALSQGRYPAALGLFEELYRKGPWDESVSMGRAVALQKMGQISTAVAAYEEIVEKNPKNVEALTNTLGLLNGQTPDEAIEKLLRLREVSPFNADVTAQLGIVYGAAGDYENALKYIEMADALKPGSLNILYNRAVVYDRMGRTTQAADIYRQILLLAGDGVLDRNFPVETVRKRLSVIR